MNLQDSDHPFWRTFLTKNTINFYRLHLELQSVLEWRNETPFRFQLGETLFGDPQVTFLTLPNEKNARYRDRFGEDEHIGTAANAYEVTLLVARVFKGHSALTAEQIVKLLSNDNLQSGVLGEYRFQRNRLGGPFLDFPVALKRVKDGRIQELPSLKSGLTG